MIRRSLLVAAAALLLSSCGDDTLDPSPVQAQAISTLIDAELSSDEQRCMLEGLIDSGIEPESVLDGSLTGEADAELLVVAMECVENLAEIPAYVQAFIDGAASEGATLTEAEVRCAINTLDPTTAIIECFTFDDSSFDETAANQKRLDLLSTACEAGNNQICDELYLVAPSGSGYEETGRTCAGQLPDSLGLRCYLDLDT